MKLKKRMKRQRAREQGHKHFIYACEQHGLGRHYTSSGVCQECDKECKGPVKQAAYWKLYRARLDQQKQN